MRDKIKINSKRLIWCLDHFSMSIDDLSAKLNISSDTLNKKEITIKQLEKIANFFNRSLVFFIEPNDVQEDKIFSPNFRTLNNQKIHLSIEVKKIIERVEKQRAIYLSILEDLEATISTEWSNYKINENERHNKLVQKVRNWLNLENKNDFGSIREQVENSGIMVILTNSYNGKWKIDKQDDIAGFSLYYEKLPVIVVKKEFSTQRQSFTLLHELGHLLMHNESMIDAKDDLLRYEGKEKEANEFAGNVLIPNDYLSQIDISKLHNLNFKEYDQYLDDFKNKWGASRQVIMLKLLKENKINQQEYNDYIKFKENESDNSNLVNSRGGQRYRDKEPLKIFGQNYVKCIFDALNNNHITLSKASTYLDDLKINDVKKLQYEL